MKGIGTRTLAWALVIVMLFSSLPLSAFAADIDRSATESTAETTQGGNVGSEGDFSEGGDAETASDSGQDSTDGTVSPDSEEESNDTGETSAPAVLYRTYIFRDEDGNELSRQIAAEGDILTQPATPSKDGFCFMGWLDAGGNRFNFPVTVSGVTEDEETVITASFEKLHYIYFADQDGKIEATRSGITGDSVRISDVSIAVDADEKVIGWVCGDETYTESYTLGEEDVTMTPVVVKGFWVSYDSDGGSYVTPSFYATGTAPVEPAEPTRPGYAFAGWMTEDGTVADFSSIASNTALTASWTAVETNYTVIYWAENADDKEYSFIRSEQKKGITGSMTDITAGSYDTGFELPLIEQKTIAGDGSTIVNVCYQRSVYTLTFVVTHEHVYSSRTGNRMEGYTYYGGCYPESGGKNVVCGKTEGRSYTEATITAKYGAKISDRFSEAPFSTTYAGRAWECTESDKYSYALQTLDRMPAFDANFKLYNKSSNDKKTIYYYVQEVGAEVSPSAWPKDNANFELLKSVDTYFNYATYNEEYHDILGFTRYDSETAKFDRKNIKYFSNGKLDLYYLRNSYQVIYMNNGEEVNKTSYQYQADISAVDEYVLDPSSAPAGKEGYIFAGWYKDANCTARFVSKGKTMPANNLTLYAKWAEPVHTVTILSVSADGEQTQTMQVPHGGTVALPAYTAPDGYTFLGWVTENDEPFNAGTLVYANITIRTLITSSAAYTVRYNANGGAGNVPVDENKYAAGAKACTLCGDSLTAPDGKVFLGWASYSKAIVPEYYPGSTVEIGSADVVLYAVWGEPLKTVELTYHANFGDNETIVDNNIPNNSKVVLKGYTELFSDRKGYTFKGWSTSAEGSAVYSAGSSIRVNVGGDNHLYAAWEANTVSYRIEYYEQQTDGTYKLQRTNFNNKAKTGETVSVTETDKTPSSSEFVFDAENTNNILTGNVKGDGTLTLKVYFERNTSSYTIHYYLNNDTGKPILESKTVESVVGVQVTEEPAEVEGYTLIKTGGAKTFQIDADPDKNVYCFWYYKNVTLTANSETATYDGTEKFVSGFTSSESGADFSAITVGTVGTDPGTYDAKFAENTVGTVDANEQYIVTETVDGKLVIEPITNDITVYITGNSETATYDGEEHTAVGWKVTKIEGSDAYDESFISYVPTNGSTDEISETAAGTYSMGLTERNFRNTNVGFSNVKFVITDGTLIINPRPVTVSIVGSHDSMVYSGEVRQVTGYVFTCTDALYLDTYCKTADDGTVAKAEGKNVGTYWMGLSNDSFVNTNGNFDVTFNITDGYLEISRQPVTIAVTGRQVTASYDGMEHVAEGFTVSENTPSEISVALADGKTARASRTEAGQTDLGLERDSFTVTGDANYAVTLEVTDGYVQIVPVVDEVVVKLHGNNLNTTYTGKEQSIAGYTVDSISNELYTVADFGLRDGATAEASGTDVLVREGSRFMGLTADSFENKSSNFTDVKFVVEDGYLNINKAPLTVTTDSDEKNYDGVELTAAGTVEGFVNNENATFIVTGSQTAVGESFNTYTLAWDGTAKEGNYRVIEKIGTLRVTQKTDRVTVTITGKTETLTYDGKEHILSGYDVQISDSLYTLNDFSFSGTKEIRGIDVGTYNMGLKSTDFTNANANFANVEFVVTDGVLMIQPAKPDEYIMLNTADVEKNYDGTIYTAGTAVASDKLGNVLTVEYSTDGTNWTADPGTITAKNVSDSKTVQVRVTSANYDGYVTGTESLTIGKRTVTITSGTNKKEYDGTVLTEHTYTVGGEKFVDGEGVTLSYTGKQTNVGESGNKFTYTPNDGTLEENYIITVVFGTLTVTGDKIIPEKTTPTVASNYGLGDKIPFTITVENVSDAEVKNITVTDWNATIVAGDGYTVSDDGHTASIESIAPNAAVPVSAEHTVTSDDILEGKVGNTATVQWDDTKKEVAAESENITSPVTALTVSKASDKTDGVKLGETITYTITVRNDGNVPYSNVKIVDELTKFTATIAELGVGESKKFTTSYIVTSADILAGKVVNTVTAKGDGITDPKTGEQKIPAGEGKTENETADVDTTLTVVKTPDKTADVTLGDAVTYTISVKNEGNVPYYNVVVNDELTEFTAAIAELKVGEKKDFTTFYTVTEEDVLAGKIINIATAGADPVSDPKNPEIPKTPDGKGETQSNTTVPKAELIVEKKAANAHSDGSPFRLGEKITYEITVTAPKTNNVTLLCAELTDTMLTEANIIGNIVDAGEVEVVDSNHGKTVNLGVLKPGDSRTICYTYTVQESDLGTDGEFGMVRNTASATAVAPTVTGDGVAQPVNPEASTTIESNTAIKLTVTANDNTVVYDGAPHSGNGCSPDALMDGHEIKSVSISGGGTKVGIYEDSLIPTAVSIRSGEKDVTAYYEITYAPGSLYIESRSIIVAAKNVTVEYDSTPHGADGYTLGNMDSTNTVESVVIEGEEKVYAGTYTDEFKPTDILILDASGEDVTENYTPTFVPGTLVIKPSSKKIVVTVVGNDATHRYTGSTYTVEGYTFTIGDPLYSEEDFVFTGSATISGAEPGRYTMGMTAADFQNLNENFANICFDVTDGSLTVFTTKYRIAWLYDTDEMITGSEETEEFRKLYSYINANNFNLVIHTGNVVEDAADQSQWDVFNKGMEKIYDDKNSTEVLVVGGEKETAEGSKFREQEELRDTDDVFDKDKDLFEDGKAFAYRFNVGSTKMILVGMDADAVTEEGILWVKQKFDEYKSYTGILMVNTYLLSDFTDGEYVDENAKMLEEKIVEECSNIRFVLSSSGGYSSHHTFNYGGRKVNALNVDITDAAKSGYFTVLYFDEQFPDVSVVSYSPFKRDYIFDNDRTEDENYTLKTAY